MSLGTINVEPLAQALFSGGLNPSFLPPVQWQPAYLPAGQTSTLPQWEYATDGFANQLASLLGGSVVKGQPTGNYQAAPGSPLPDADWISADGQMILPGNLFQPGTILSFPDLCTAENYLTNSIPGSEFGSSCAHYAQSTANPLIGSGGTQAPAAAPPVSLPVSLPTTSVPRVPVSLAPALPQTVQSQLAPAVSGTPGANVSAATGAPAAQPAVAAAGFSLSDVPWWGWGLAGAALLFAVKGAR